MKNKQNTCQSIIRNNRIHEPISPSAKSYKRGGERSSSQGLKQCPYIFRFFVLLTEIYREKKGYMEADLIDIILI
jgi:hypothetical protein